MAQAQVFVELVGARDSVSVYSALEQRRYMAWSDRLGGPYKGWVVHLDWWWRGVDEHCTVTFLDGSRLTCHIGVNVETSSSDHRSVSDLAQRLRPVSLESSDPERALALREYVDRNETIRAFAEALEERPGLHMDAATGDVASVAAPDRLSIEGGELKVEKSHVWDWRAALKEKLRGLRGTCGRR